jgi:hypothetical protein
MNSIIIIASALAVVIIYTVIFWVYKLHHYSQWLSYIESLYHFGIIFAILGFLNNMINSQYVDAVNYISKINQNQEASLTSTERTFMEHYPELLPLYKEINQQNKKIQAIPIPFNIDPIKRKTMESNICNIIIQNIGNTYLEITYLEKYHKSNYIQSQEFATWISILRQWFKSPTLRSLWDLDKETKCSPRTIDFIDGVIIKGNEPKKSYSLYI